MHNQDQEETEILRDILNGVKELMIETHRQRKEVRELWDEIEVQYNQGAMTEMTFAVEKEQFRRTNENIDFCLRSLDRQKKIALNKLQELE
jgi:hypothetical protein